MTIRLATDADIDGLAGLAETIRLRRQPMAALSSSPRSQPLLVRRRLERSSLPVLVADDNGELVLAAWCKDADYRSEPWWVLDEMLVAPGGWPARGIAVVAAVAGRARALGVAGLVVGIEAGDHEASASLAAAGLTRAAQWWQVPLSASANDAFHQGGETPVRSIAAEDRPNWFDTTPTSPASAGPIVETLVITDRHGSTPLCCAAVRTVGSIHGTVAALDPIDGPGCGDEAMGALVRSAAASAQQRNERLVVPIATSNTPLTQVLVDHNGVPHSEWWTLRTD